MNRYKVIKSAIKIMFPVVGTIQTTFTVRRINVKVVSKSWFSQWLILSFWSSSSSFPSHFLIVNSWFFPSSSTSPTFPKPESSTFYPLSHFSHVSLKDQELGIKWWRELKNWRSEELDEKGGEITFNNHHNNNNIISIVKK